MKKRFASWRRRCGALGLTAVLAVSSLVPGVAAAAEEKETDGEITMNVISDLHYYPLSLSNGEDSLAGTDFRLKNESTAATDAALDQIIANKPEMLVITGDLTNNGEQESAEELAVKLQRVEEAGIPVFVINGNHDIQGSSGEDLTASEFRDIFRQFGYDGEYDAEYYQPVDTADEEAVQGGLSYVVSPKPGVKLLMIDTEVYTPDYSGQSEGMISDDLMDWIQEQIEEAQKNGETLVAGMHHPLLAHYSGDEASALSDTIDNSTAVADQLADAGLKFIFSGHMHENDIAEHQTNRGNKIIDMETGSLVAYGAPVRTVTVSKDDISVQASSIKEIQWGGQTIDYRQHMDEIIYPDGFFIHKALGVVDGVLDDVQADGIKASVEGLAGIDIDSLLSSAIQSALTEPVDVDISFGQLQGLQLSYDESSGSVVMHAVTSSPNSNFPDLNISVQEDILPEVDHVFEQIDTGWIADQGGDSRVRQAVQGLLQDLSDAVVYTDSDGGTKTLSDFLAEMLKRHNLGGETPEGWTAEVLDDLNIELTRKLAKEVILPDIMELLHGILDETTIDAMALTNAEGAGSWGTILDVLLGTEPSLADILDLASLDVDALIDDLVAEYVDNDSYVGMVGQPLSSLAAGFLEDTEGEDDQIDGSAVTYHIEDADGDASPELDFNSLTVGMGSSQDSASFTWFCNSGEAGMVQIAKKADKPAGKEFPEDPELYTEVQAENHVTSFSSGYYSNSAVVSGLEENTDYIYRVGNEGVWEGVHELRMEDLDGNFSFLFAGDPQIGSSGSMENDIQDWENTLNLSEEKFPSASFLISSGDQINTADSEEEYEGFLEHDVLKGMKLTTVVGNHDSGSQLYSDHFTVPNAASDSGTEDTGASGGDYWFTYNGVLFMMLNSNNTNTEEHEAFMKQAIAENEENGITWKVVVFHHSIFSVANHSESADILMRRNQLAPVFSELDIDVVMMGHDHSYTRTYMMNGTTPQDTEDGVRSSVTDPEDGDVLYLTANSASSKHYTIKDSQFSYAAVENQENLDNITDVQVTPGSFKITTYRTESADHVPVSADEMTVVDEFTIYKTSQASDVDRTAPVLNVPDDGVIAVGDDFDPMDGVTSWDETDGDLTGKVQIEGQVDTSVPGEYRLIYTVQDEAGNYSEAVRFVTVQGEAEPGGDGDSGAVENPGDAEIPGDNTGTDVSDPSGDQGGQPDAGTQSSGNASGGTTQTADADTPRTGDDSFVTVTVLAILAAGAGCLAAACVRRRRI